MVLTAVMAALVAGTDYFPLHEGDEYQYEEKIGARTYALVKKVGAPVTDTNQTLIPLVTDTGTGDPDTTHYVEGDDTVKVFMVASRQKKVKGAPQVDENGYPVMEKREISYPVFKSTTNETEWAYSGQTALLSDFASLDMTGKSKFLGQKKVLGAPRDVIQVTLTMTVGAADGPSIRETNVTYYAKGVGPYQMDSVQIFGKRKVERHLRLLAYNPKVGTQS